MFESGLAEKGFWVLITVGPVIYAFTKLRKLDLDEPTRKDAIATLLVVLMGSGIGAYNLIASRSEVERLCFEKVMLLDDLGVDTEAEIARVVDGGDSGQLTYDCVRAYWRYMRSG